jgi:hypothetical protein
MLVDISKGDIKLTDAQLIQIVLKANNQDYTEDFILTNLSREDVFSLFSSILDTKGITGPISIWRPNIDKYISIFMREYRATKTQALFEYTWSEISELVSLLPVERIITVYEGKKAKNNERYLEALCDKDITSASKDISSAEAEFERRRKLKNKE